MYFNGHVIVSDDESVAVSINIAFFTLAASMRLIFLVQLILH